MKKILFVLPSLRGGGAERVMVTLLKYLDRNKFDLHLALVVKEGPYIEEVPCDVKIYDLRAKRVRFSIRPLYHLIRKLKPDLVFSTLGHLNIALIILKMLVLPNISLIVREANTVSEAIKMSPNPWLWRLLYKLFYKRADFIICQSDYMKNDLVHNFGVPESKTVRIYNPVDIDLIQHKSLTGANPFSSSQSSPNVIAIGRLVPQKGFDRLINYFPLILKFYPNAKLWIIGTGPLESQLRQQCKQIGIAEKVNFVGFQNNPYKWMKHADLFILSSYYEGLPNVLLEAIACSCPVLVFPHIGGGKEIMDKLRLQHKLIEKQNHFSPDFMEPPREEHQQKLKDHFGIHKIVREYERLFQDTP